VRPVGEAGDIANVGQDAGRDGRADTEDAHRVGLITVGGLQGSHGRRAGKSAGSKRAAATRAGDRQVRVWRCAVVRHGWERLETYPVP
jgi:hypothetical protein